MGFWKILGGVAAGTVMPLSLPVGGAIAAAAAVGAVAGAAASAHGEEKRREDARKSAERRAAAEYQRKLEKLVSALRDAQDSLHDDKLYFQLLIALFAVGMATANADGDISDEEMADLDEFVAGVGHSNLPPHVKRAITELRDSPPSFTTAMKHVSKLEDVDLSFFESVIEVVSASDGKVSEEESALLVAFRKAAGI